MKRLRLMLSLWMAVVLTACSAADTPEPALHHRSADKTTTIAIVQTSSHQALDDMREWIYQELAAAGYKNENSNCEIIYENLMDDEARADSTYSSLKNKPIDLYIPIGTMSSVKAKEHIDRIPIVFMAVTDPVSTGILSDPNHPSGLLTGSCDHIDQTDVMDLMLDIKPDLKTLGVLYSDVLAGNVQEIEKLKNALGTRNVSVKEYYGESKADLEKGMKELCQECDAVYSPSNNQVASNTETLAEIALSEGIPYFGAFDTMARNGCLAAISGDNESLAKETAMMAIRVLEGESPSDLPVIHYDTPNIVTVNKAVFEALDAMEQNTLFSPEGYDRIVWVNRLP